MPGSLVPSVPWADGMGGLHTFAQVRSLQVLVAALRTTLGEVVNLVTLLLLLIYIFAIMGYYFFGYQQQGESAQDWNNLGAGCMSLFVMVTADGWTDLQAALDRDGHAGSRVFTTIFMAIGHFIFINLFIGVVIRNIEQAKQQEQEWQDRRRESAFMTKKRAELRRQVRGGPAPSDPQNSVGASVGRCTPRTAHAACATAGGGACARGILCEPEHCQG
eukprot:SAG25_NODE_338_length_9538_cov_22.622630_5_plen_218_part_00